MIKIAAAIAGGAVGGALTFLLVKIFPCSKVEWLCFKIGEIIYEDDLGKNEVIEVRFKNKKILPSDLIRKTSVIDIVLGNGKLNSE